MKILALTNLYPPHYLGGYELICHAVVNNLRRRGHDVHVLTSEHRCANASGAEDPSIDRTLKIHGFYGHPWRGIGSLAKLEIANNKIVRETIARVKPDLVYVWNMGGVSKSILATLERLGIPTAFYLSDHWIARGLQADVWLNWWTAPKTTFAKKAIRTVFRRGLDPFAPIASIHSLKFKRIYFCSRALRKLTASAGFDVMHGAVIYCPVDVKKFDGPAKRAEEPCRKLLWVGRLSEDKGIMTALRAMRELRGKFDGHLNVYGGGDAPYVEKLKAFVAEHRLPVTFKKAAMAEMPQVYREHDALLFTSEWAEPFALTPIEAMASGLPVIGTLTGGSRELFRHRDNSLTYTAGEPTELADRILKMAENGPMRARLSATAQVEVRANYNEDHIVDQIEAYLKETVAIWPTLGR